MIFNAKYIFPVIVFFLLFMFSCADEENHSPKLKSTNVKTETPDQVSFNPEVVFVDSSFTKAILKADEARVYQARMETILDGNLRVDFFSKETGERVSYLTADSARIDDRTKDMLAMGNVIVISDSSETKLETDVLQWSNKERKLFSTEFVKITSPKQYIEGMGFESDQSLDNYKVMKVMSIQSLK